MSVVDQSHLVPSFLSMPLGRPLFWLNGKVHSDLGPNLLEECSWNIAGLFESNNKSTTINPKRQIFTPDKRQLLKVAQRAKRELRVSVIKTSIRGSRHDNIFQPVTCLNNVGLLFNCVVTLQRKTEKVFWVRAARVVQFLSSLDEIILFCDVAIAVVRRNQWFLHALQVHFMSSAYIHHITFNFIIHVIDQSRMVKKCHQNKKHTWEACRILVSSH